MGFKRISLENPSTSPSYLFVNIDTLTPKTKSLVAICDICGFQFIDLHCKLRCIKCGYMRDCSDP